MTCKNMLREYRDGLRCVDSLNHNQECEKVVTDSCKGCDHQQDLKCKVCMICHPTHDDSNLGIGSICYDCAMAEIEWNDFERDVYS